MTPLRHSRLAIASLLLQLPWMVVLGGCFAVYWWNNGTIAGELFLIPFAVWFWTSIPAGIGGLIAWQQIRNSPQTVRGKGIALLAITLTLVVPVLGFVENMWGVLREAQINRTPQDPTP